MSRAAQRELVGNDPSRVMLLKCIKGFGLALGAGLASTMTTV